MAFARVPRMIPGVWGPYLGGALPGLWMNEGGQSAAGGLLDHILRLHGQDPTPASTPGLSPASRSSAAPTPDLAPRLHVLPDFHGNRSPLADPHALGVISGLPLDSSFDALCPPLLAHLRRHRPRTPRHPRTPEPARHVIDTLHVTGGHTRNPLLMELYADATRCRTVEPLPPTPSSLALPWSPPPPPPSTRPSPPPAPPCTRAARSANRTGDGGALRAGLAGVPGDAAAPGGVGLTKTAELRKGFGEDLYYLTELTRSNRPPRDPQLVVREALSHLRGKLVGRRYLREQRPIPISSWRALTAPPERQ